MGFDTKWPLTWWPCALAHGALPEDPSSLGRGGLQFLDVLVRLIPSTRAAPVHGYELEVLGDAIVAVKDPPLADHEPRHKYIRGLRYLTGNKEIESSSECSHLPIIVARVVLQWMLREPNSAEELTDDRTGDRRRRPCSATKRGFPSSPQAP